MKTKSDVQILRDYLRSKGRKVTTEREALLRVIKSMKGRYSMEQLFQKASKKQVIYARTTLFYNVPLFIDAGFIKVRKLPNGRKVYETKH